jgi:hypothetical protein
MKPMTMSGERAESESSPRIRSDGSSQAVAGMLQVEVGAETFSAMAAAGLGPPNREIAINAASNAQWIT